MDYNQNLQMVCTKVLKQIIRWLNKHNWLYGFISISVISIMISFITRHFIVNEEVVYQSLSERLPSEKIDELMVNRTKFEWVGYLLMPIFKFMLFVIISAILATGIYLKSYRISFIKILTVVIYSSFVFLIPSLIKTVYFFSLENSFTMDEFQNFHPYSLLYYVNYDRIDIWFYYPIYLVNFFEISFWVALAIGIKIVSKLSFLKSVILILQTYVLSLLLWIVFVMFISINVA